MLASTVQFSKYGESPHLPHRQTPASSEEPHGRYDGHGALQKKQSPVPSGPNSVPTTPHSTRSRSRPRRDVLGTRHSRRPNWSVFHPRAPSRTPEHLQDEGTS